MGIGTASRRRHSNGTSQGPNGNSDRASIERELQALLASAEQVRERAKTARLDFVAYLAEMTVLEIAQEIDRRSGAQPDSDQ